MKTLRIKRDFFDRMCTVCGYRERLPRAGRIWRGTSIQAETFREGERRQYAKEHLQAYEPNGTVNPLFQDAFGDPQKRGKSRMGEKVNDTRIEDDVKD